MSEGDDERIRADDLKRPAVSAKNYAQIRAIAQQNMAFDAKSVGWDKCLETVIQEYVPGTDRETSPHTKGYADE